MALAGSCVHVCVGGGGDISDVNVRTEKCFFCLSLGPSVRESVACVRVL
jgi:hypothetical protein